MTEYNYQDFNFSREAPHFEAFRDHLHVGERAPSYPLEQLDTGKPVQLKDLWAEGVLIIEFGSFT